MRTATRQRPRFDPTLAASKRFGQYKGESEQRVRQVEVKESPTRKQLLELFKAPFVEPEFEDCPSGANGIYGIYIAALWEARETLRYGPRDIEELSVGSKPLFDHIAKEKNLPEFMMGPQGVVGAFFSALINFGPDEKYRIHTSSADGFEDACFLGYRNQKEIEVFGDVGSMLGMRMRNGVIHVHGNFSDEVGLYMEGGEIHLHGKPLDGLSISEAIGSDIKGGRIFHKKKQIYPK